MSQPWKLLPLAAMAAVALILGSLAVGERSANANIASIDIEAIAAGDDVESSVTVTSEDDRGDLVIAISGGDDIDIEDVTCSGCTGAAIDISGSQVTIDTAGLDGGTEVEGGLTTTVVFTVDCEEDDEISVTAQDSNDDQSASVTCSEGATATPTGTVTGTPGAAATVTTKAEPASVSCSGSSVVTIAIKDANGKAVAPGTVVNITASMGTVSPPSGQTTGSSGTAFVFFQAPSNQGGTATITAKAGDAQGTATVTVNCGATPTATTAAPPPTVAPGGGGGVITPPNTGNAGLAPTEGKSTATVLAGLAVAVVALSGAAVIVRARA